MSSVKLTELGIIDQYNQLDSINKSLFDEVNAYAPLTFILVKEDGYYSKYKKDLITGKEVEGIVYTHDPLNQAKVCHELLHLKASMNLGDSTVLLTIPDGNFAKLIVTSDFAEQLVGNAEHIMFYPNYKQYGYPDSDFFEPIEDDFLWYCDQICKTTLKIHDVYQNTRVTNYMNIVVLYKTYPFGNKYKKPLKRLRSVEPALFTIIENFINAVKIVPITVKSNLVQQQYILLRDNILKWCNGKNIAIG